MQCGAAGATGGRPLALPAPPGGREALLDEVDGGEEDDDEEEEDRWACSEYLQTLRAHWLQLTHREAQAARCGNCAWHHSEWLVAYA